MPAPKIMDPAQKCGLYNPNPLVRRMAVEAMGEFYGVQVMKKWERDEALAKARVQQYASRPPVPYAPVHLTDEEQMGFDELIGDYQEEETAASEGDGGEGEPNGLEEGYDLADAAAAALEETTEEEIAKMEKNGADSAVEGATSEPAVGAAAVEMKEKSSLADTATEGTRAKEPAQTQKEKKTEQTMPAPGTTAWYLQRGKELDRKRI